MLAVVSAHSKILFANDDCSLLLTEESKNTDNQQLVAYMKAYILLLIMFYLSRTLLQN